RSSVHRPAMQQPVPHRGAIAVPAGRLVSRGPSSDVHDTDTRRRRETEHVIGYRAVDAYIREIESTYTAIVFGDLETSRQRIARVEPHLERTVLCTLTRCECHCIRFTAGDGF